MSRTITIPDPKTLHIDDLPPRSVVVHMKSEIDERSNLPLWSELHEQGRCITIIEEYDDRITLELPSGTIEVHLSELDTLNESLARFEAAVLDISGLSHSTWAPLLRYLRRTMDTLDVLYAEPRDYTTVSFPVASGWFDLSQRFSGIAPLPGFACLRPHDPDQDSLLVAFVGFEGQRPRMIVEELDDPPPSQIFPVVGMPGFRAEFPTFSLVCNQDFFDDTRSVHETRFARASCPFEAYRQLREIAREHPSHYMYIAPVGTKPHALGAVLYTMEHPEVCELIYDHPVRKKGRTSGIGAIHLYRIRDRGEVVVP